MTEHEVYVVQAVPAPDEPDYDPAEHHFEWCTWCVCDSFELARDIVRQDTRDRSIIKGNIVKMPVRTR